MIRVRMREPKARWYVRARATRKSSSLGKQGKGASSELHLWISNDFYLRFQRQITRERETFGRSQGSAYSARFTFFIAARELGRDWDYQQKLRKRKAAEFPMRSDKD